MDAWDLSGLGLTHLSDSDTPFSEAKRLDLSHNNLDTLVGIERYSYLEHLSISSNQICSLQELRRINCPHLLKELDVSDNPFCVHPNYRMLIFKMFPNLERLDSLSLACNEISEVSVLSSHLSLILVPFLTSFEYDEKILEETLNVVSSPATPKRQLTFEVIDSILEVQQNQLLNYDENNPVLTSQNFEINKKVENNPKFVRPHLEAKILKDRWCTVAEFFTWYSKIANNTMHSKLIFLIEFIESFTGLFEQYSFSWGSQEAKKIFDNLLSSSMNINDSALKQCLGLHSSDHKGKDSLHRLWSSFMATFSKRPFSRVSYVQNIGGNRECLESGEIIYDIFPIFPFNEVYFEKILQLVKNRLKPFLKKLETLSEIYEQILANKGYSPSTLQLLASSVLGSDDLSDRIEKMEIPISTENDRNSLCSKSEELKSMVEVHNESMRVNKVLFQTNIDYEDTLRHTSQMYSDDINSPKYADNIRRVLILSDRSFFNKASQSLKQRSLFCMSKSIHLGKINSLVRVVENGLARRAVDNVKERAEFNRAVERRVRLRILLRRAENRVLKDMLKRSFYKVWCCKIGISFWKTPKKKSGAKLLLSSNSSIKLNLPQGITSKKSSSSPKLIERKLSLLPKEVIAQGSILHKPQGSLVQPISQKKSINGTNVGVKTEKPVIQKLKGKKKSINNENRKTSKERPTNLREARSSSQRKKRSAISMTLASAILEKKLSSGQLVSNPWLQANTGAGHKYSCQALQNLAYQLYSDHDEMKLNSNRTSNYKDFLFEKKKASMPKSSKCTTPIGSRPRDHFSSLLICEPKVKNTHQYFHSVLSQENKENYAIHANRPTLNGGTIASAKHPK